MDRTEASYREATYEDLIQGTVGYLASDLALRSIEADPYWPKWNSPWWHMLLLHEMGRTKDIPAATIAAYVAALDRIPLKIFPIHAEDMPAGIDPYRGTPCHCQLGNVYQVLAAWGVDVDAKLPWIRPWFLRYQMADGGLSCDNDAYLVEGECPSSMVGTIAAFEAVLLFTPRPWTAEERVFLDRGAQFLVERQLMHGSSTQHNAAERTSAPRWLQLCFPRFYLYDVLRGLNALLAWGEKTQQSVPPAAVRSVVDYLAGKAAGGKLSIERLSYEGVGTILQDPSGEWVRRQPATFFPLLDAVSAVGQTSPYLSKQWANAVNRMARLPGLQGLLA